MKRFVLCITLVAACALAGGAAAATDMFLKFDGVKGESTDDRHKDWIDVLAYSLGASNSATIGSGGAGAGKVSFQDFSFTKFVDASSPVLFFDLASGKHIKDALFDVVQVGDMSPFLQYKFSDVLMTSYSVGSGGETPTENWSFVFGRIDMTYRPQKPDGSLGAPITAFWDVTKNTGGLNTAPIPEPSTWAMLAAGLAFVLFFGRNRVRARGFAA